ncbi:MAG TPA: sulfite exporter TauE/SafE family protein [Polyangiaceae bacterium]
MRDLVLFALAGFAASLVDGALGMGFGPTSSSILLGAGLTPAAVSASVNLAKVASGVVAGVSHWRFKNIDKGLVLSLAIPGVVGALIGVTVLSNVNAGIIKPLLAVLLSVIGLRILFRFSRLNSMGQNDSPESDDPPTIRPAAYSERGTKVAALVGGITNGMIGAWGPVVTPYLLHRGVRPRYAIGSVNTAEVAVASASAVSLLLSMGKGGFNVAIVIAMLIGGVIAAPVAAWLIRFVPARPMGIAVAALLLLTNARELAAWAGLGATAWVWAIYAAVIAVITAAIVTSRLRARTATRPQPLTVSTSP